MGGSHSQPEISFVTEETFPYKQIKETSMLCSFGFNKLTSSDKMGSCRMPGKPGVDTVLLFGRQWILDIMF